MGRGAICLTFDDTFVEHWIDAIPLFDAFEVRVTFCVCHLHTLDRDALDGLHVLQRAGHEIAYHTRNHLNATQAIEKLGVAEWARTELDIGIAEHRQAGFPATSLAAALGGSAVFAGHDIRASADGAGFYLTLDDLGHVLEMAHDLGLGSITLSEMGPTNGPFANFA